MLHSSCLLATRAARSPRYSRPAFAAALQTAKDAKGNEKVILNNVSGFVLPKHMLAIMGPSGSGKVSYARAQRVRWFSPRPEVPVSISTNLVL